MAMGAAHFFANRFGDAEAMLRRLLQEHSGWAPTYGFLAATYAHLGRLKDAREAVEHLSAITPLIVPTGMHRRDSQHRELYLSGRRLAVGEVGGDLAAFRAFRCFRTAEAKTAKQAFRTPQYLM
jgi:hypothetical protein